MTLELLAERDLLKEQIKEKDKQIKKLEKERDTAVDDILHDCPTCLYRNKPHECGDCDIYNEIEDNWKWRGYQEEK